MQYYQNASDVWGATYNTGYCDHSIVPGWTVSQCVYSVGTGATYVQIAMQGEYHFGTIGYQQHAFTRTYFDNSLTRTCYFDWGSLPPFWSSTCAGGRTNV
jgi:hypothetical protein